MSVVTSLWDVLEGVWTSDRTDRLGILNPSVVFLHVCICKLKKKHTRNYRECENRTALHSSAQTKPRVGFSGGREKEREREGREGWGTELLKSVFCGNVEDMLLH